MDHSEDATAMTAQHISVLIDESPMNRGASGAAWVANPDNRAIVENETVVLFERTSCYAAEFHWLKASKNVRATIRDTREAIRRYFEDHPFITALYGLVPTDRRDSLLMARWIGSVPGQIFDTPDGPCQGFVMTRRHFQGDI